MPSSKASEAATGSHWLGAKASMHFSVDLEVSSRIWFHQLVVSVGAYLASALGITASIIVLCLAPLLPASRPAPAEATPEKARRLRPKSVKRKKAVADLSSKVAPEPTLQRPPMPARHVSFQSQMPPSRPPSPLRKSSTSVPRRSSPPPSPRPKKLGLRRPSSPARLASAVSDDEASRQRSQPASPEPSGSDPLSRPTTQRKRPFFGLRRANTTALVPEIAVSPITEAESSPKPGCARLCDQLKRVDSAASSSFEGSGSADEHGSLASATTAAGSVESARERGRFGWRLASKSRNRSSKSRTRASSQPRPSTEMTPPVPALPLPPPIDTSVEGAAAEFVMSPLTTSPTSLVPDELDALPAVDSASTAGSAGKGHRRGSSASSGRKGFISPLTPNMLPTELCPPGKTKRKTSAGSPPARTQPYAYPYFAPPPEISKWGVRTPEDEDAPKRPTASPR
ncbi:hypothetical protein PENSPDRAFT_662646 [Peniophora sp. CONT]|nr:hypothetical protein PENSPDRAFT_662646 [Peniophora sp. CONT]